METSREPTSENSLPQWHDLEALLPTTCRSIIDIGCGDGRTLALCPNIATRVGVDCASTEIERARKTVPGAQFYVANAEVLPFADETFDAAISCVALPYVNIPRAVTECARVLRKGGVFYLSVHSWEFINLVWRKSKPNIKGRVFHAYIVLNGLSLHFFGKVFPYPLKPSLTESFQTDRGMMRTLVAAGFRDIRKLSRRVPSFIALR